MASKDSPTTTRGMNYYTTDANLNAFLRRTAPAMMQRQDSRLSDLGAWVGNDLDAQAEYSDRHAQPKLVQDLVKPGERRNRVVFNSQYEEAQREIYRRGVIGLSFSRPSPEPHTLSFVMGYLLSHSDISTHCPVTMTGAVAYVVEKYASPAVKAKFLHESTRMDGAAKTGGTWATEKHSGSDIAQTTSIARKAADGSYRLSGQKWFASNASSGLVIATARAEGGAEGGKGLGLYLVPSHIDDQWAVPNSYEISALKEKLGTRALATAEINLNDAYAVELVPPPHGLRVMMEALGYSRVHNSMSAAGVARRALLEALNWMDNRRTFGEILSEQDINKEIFLDMAVNSFATSALAFEAAHSFDVSQSDQPADKAWMRIVTAIAKYRTADLGVSSAITASQMIGGNGVTAEWATERLVRDAMVLPVWEGPRQIQALDLLRIIDGPEKGSGVFMRKLSDIVQALPPGMTTEKTVLVDKMSALGRDMDRLTGIADDKARRRHGKLVAGRLLSQSADVLTYALLCQEAGWEMVNDNNPIKLIAARRFADRTFLAPHDIPEITAERLSEEFNALVRGIIPKMSAASTISAPAP